MQKQGEHLNLVQTAARSVSEILSKENMDCCLFGSLAAKMFGNNRCPKDADILILQRPGYPTLDAEALKRLIAEKRPKNFYLKMPKDPEAPYRILWFSLRGPPPPTKASSSSLEANDAKPKQRNHRLASECKVDILIPGTLSLPKLPATRITWIEGIPCIPYPVLLLQKLQSWDDHRNMKGDDLWKRKKMPTDAADVRRLLNLKIVVQENVVKPGIEIVWKDAELFDDEQFMTVSRRRVRKYCEAHPDRAAEWKRLGFEVGPVDDPTDDEVEVVKEGAGGAVDEEEDLDDLDEEE
ncbi:hypothetical protein DL96DRAFT_1474466 [Flagelloscypha sp. PMI_526]|nr:hypothetical protein DL96DRAFT_1474466 [Flagelloscypha sp. PMI_526]